MYIYTVDIRNFKIDTKEELKKTYPINTPKSKSKKILVELNEKFPETFHYWDIDQDDFVNKSKTASFRTISKMFHWFEENNIYIGIKLSSFYKLKEKAVDPPIEGSLIYEYRNIRVFFSKVG